MKNGVCPKCNSHVIIKNKPIPDRSHANAYLGYVLQIMIEGKKTGLFSRHMAEGELRAWVCGECGYTELYTTNFKELLEADRESKLVEKSGR